MIELPKPSNFGASAFRSIEVQDAYRRHCIHKQSIGDTSCDMCDRPNKEGIDAGLLAIIEKDFSLFKNDFPYSHYGSYKIETHDLLVPKAHIAEMKLLSKRASAALLDIILYIDELEEYDTMFKRRAGSAGSSIADHGHFHLVGLGAKLTQQTFCEECNIAEVEFRGEPHMPH